MNKELITRILIQLEPSLAQEFGLAIAKDEKKLKALEIIKKYRLIIYNEIEDAIATKGYVHNLPQDVVDLLKEVLL